MSKRRRQNTSKVNGPEYQADLHKRLIEEGRIQQAHWARMRSGKNKEIGIAQNVYEEKTKKWQQRQLNKQMVAPVTAPVKVHKPKRRREHKIDRAWRLVLEWDTTGQATMPYKEYLKSVYWKTIRRIKLDEAGWKCQTTGCPKRNPLQVHHLSYEFRGCEHMGMHTLKVLCETCHQKAHGIFVPQSQKCLPPPAKS